MGPIYQQARFIFLAGSVWAVTAVLESRNHGRQKIRKEDRVEIRVGKILIESQEIGFNRLGTFDEMLGCNKCNAIYHKDTRWGLKVGLENGKRRRPVSMLGITKPTKSVCKDYRITGSKKRSTISFEGGPLLDSSQRSPRRVFIF